MKSLLILSLLALTAMSLEFTDNCGTEYADNDSYMKVCVTDNENAGTDSTIWLQFYYSSTDGNLYTSEADKLDNVGCNDYKELNCDYFDVVPSDIGVLHNINLELEGADGVQIAAIEVKYNDNIARFDGINDNDCISVQGWETDYPQYITLDEGDVCQSAIIIFDDPMEGGEQYGTVVIADNGMEGDECLCDLSDYQYSASSGQCDSCYFVCNIDQDCEVVTDNCGTINQYEDAYVQICTSYGYMADSGTDFMIRYNYDTADEQGVQNEFAEGDNMLCDDFILGKCDYFDDVPSDAIKINFLDIQKRGTDGWQAESLRTNINGQDLAVFGGNMEQNECVTSFSENYYGNNDPSMIWMDLEDTCQTVRIHFGDDGLATTVYAIEECNCDLDISVFFVGAASGDTASCAAICYPDEFEGGDYESGTCSTVTIYSECDYAGEAIEIADSYECLTWQPQSICVPDGITVTIYDLCWYTGDSVDFTANESCMSANGLFLLESNDNAKGKVSDKHAKIEIAK